MLVNSKNFEDSIKELSYQVSYVLDIETNGLDILDEDRLCGVGICTLSGKTFYFPFRHNLGENLNLDDLKVLLRILENKIIIGHNIKFDIKGLYHEGLNYHNCLLIDTMVMARLCSVEKDMFFSLEILVDKYLGSSYAEYKKEFKKYLKKNQFFQYSKAPSDVVSKYCENDVLGTRNLYLLFNKIIKRTNQTNIWNTECKMTKVLLDMEITGIGIDLDYCRRCSDLLNLKSNEIANEVYKQSGKEFDINSNPQLREVLQGLGIKSPIKTVNGNESFNQAAIATINSPITNKIAEYRTIGVLKNTFFIPYLEKGKETIHTSFTNWKAVTGRLSCMEPNLQNLPRSTQNLLEDAVEQADLSPEAKQLQEQLIRSGAGGVTRSSVAVSGDESFDYENNVNLISVRRMFVPREQRTLYSLDYKQMEVVVFLYYLKEWALMRRITEGDLDFHSYVAIEALGANPDSENFKMMRQIAKSITFGIIYGMGLGTLAIQIGGTTSDAEDFRNKYFAKIPSALDFIFEVKGIIEKEGVISNVFGRRYVIPKDRSYVVVNYLVQGTAGDIVKECMIKVSNRLQNTKSKMLVQIHDELIVEVHDSENSILKEVAGLMKTNSLGIPMAVDISKCVGSWGSKEHYELINS